MALSAIAALFISASPAMAEATSQQLSQIDAIFARWSGSNTPGCAISVAERGAVVAKRAYGMADLDLAVPARTDSIYEAGSVSKQFTAAAILMLAREGKLRLNDDIRKYLPEMPGYGTPITVEQMLHHVSGLRDWGSVAAIEGWPRDSRTVTNADVLVIAARQKALNFTPGTHFLYSNTNFNLLAIIVERISGQTLADFTKNRVFQPLGMMDTSWRTDHLRIVPGRAHAYSLDGTRYVAGQPIEDAYGNGGLLTTTQDLQIWNDALESHRLGPGFTEAMEQQINFSSGAPLAYAAGLFKLTYGGMPEVGHPGATGGYRSWLGRYPTAGLSIALLCNAGDADTPKLARDVADIFLPPHVNATAPFAGSDQPSGVYASTVSGFPVRFGAANGVLTIDGRAIKATAPGEWSLPGGSYSFDAAHRLVFKTREGDQILFRKAQQITEISPSIYKGRYCSVDNEACWTVSATGSALSIRRPRSAELPLDPAYKDAFMLPTGEMVRFVRNAAEKVTGLAYSDARDYDLLFVQAH